MVKGRSLFYPLSLKPPDRVLLAAEVNPSAVGSKPYGKHDEAAIFHAVSVLTHGHGCLTLASLPV